MPPQGEALNRARLFANGGGASNEAAASVRVRPLLFTDAMQPFFDSFQNGSTIRALRS